MQHGIDAKGENRMNEVLDRLVIATIVNSIVSALAFGIALFAVLI